jgi:hypothetical protein
MVRGEHSALPLPVIAIDQRFDVLYERRRADAQHVERARGLSDRGMPCHDEGMGRRFTAVDVLSVGDTPKVLPRLEGALKGQDLFKLAKACGSLVEK